MKFLELMQVNTKLNFAKTEKNKSTSSKFTIHKFKLL